MTASSSKDFRPSNPTAYFTDEGTEAQIGGGMHLFPKIPQ